MRKLLFCAALVGAIIFSVILFGSCEQQSENPQNTPPPISSPLPPQTPHMESQPPISENTPFEDFGVDTTDILLVNLWNPLPDNFSTIELVTLFDYKDRQFQLAASDIQLERSVFEAAEAMFAAARKDGVNSFIITSGYRSRG